jgi:hypothetical protein
MIDLFQTAWGAIFDVLFAPFRPLGPWPAMIFISLATGLLMLAVFKKTSNQEGIRRAKDRIKAHLLEIRLYKDDFGQTFRSQGQLLAANGRYFLHAVKPMLVMFGPVFLILVQLNLWFGAAPLGPGKSAIVKVKLAPGQSALAAAAALSAPAGIAVETPPLRIEEDREIDWRVRADSPGRYLLNVSLDGREITKSLVAGGPALSKVPARRGRGLVNGLLYPGEKSLRADVPEVAAVEVGYASRRLPFLGMRVHWLAAFFVLSLIFGFALKGVFKVEI